MMRTAWLPTRFAPRWIITAMDLCLVVGALWGALLLRFEFRVPPHEWALWLGFLPIFVLIRGAVFALFRTSADILRHTGTDDARRIFWAVSVGSLAFAAWNGVRFFLWDGLFAVPFSLIGIEWLASTVGLIAVRLAVKWLYLRSFRPTGEAIHVAIFGAGEAGLIAKRAIDREGRQGSMRVVAFIDDDIHKHGKKLEGVDILSPAEARRFFAAGRVDRLIFSVQNLPQERKASLVDLALAHGIRLLDVPPVGHWINGQLTAGQIRELNIEDLLGRPAIRLDSGPVDRFLGGKRVVVTGAAGSIGSELVRQVLRSRPEAILAIDQAETPMHDLMLEVGPSGCVEGQIGDIRAEEQVRDTFLKFKPDIVFHAAAYKHVPLMEKQPWQAFETNVAGTYHVLRAAQAAGCAKLVLVSTDKAVNPTSVMGATKRMAEFVVGQIGSQGPTRCITTRFGNVLGSNGSVIPLFRRQIAAGGPVTVTDAEVTRYFMTIPEAVQLVLEAGAMGAGGEIYVFDMGASVKILDLARKMIRLAGLEEGRDIELKITGLRPGEKLHEELLGQNEDHLPTHHPQIMRARHAPAPDASFLTELLALRANPGNHEATRAFLHTWIPEFQTTEARRNLVS